MSPVDLTKVLKQSYVGKWVALSPDFKRVCAVGNTASEALAKAIKKCDNPILHKVLPFDKAFAPVSL